MLATPNAAIAAQAPSPLVTALEERLSRSPADIAFRHKRRGIWETTTWGRCRLAVTSVVSAMREAEVEEARPVVVLVPHGPARLAVEFAAAGAGLPAVMIDDAVDDADAAELLTSVGAQAFLAAGAASLARSRRLAERMTTGPGVVDLTAILQPGRSGHPAAATAAEQDLRAGMVPPAAGTVAMIAITRRCTGGAQLDRLTHGEIAEWLGGVASGLPRQAAVLDALALGGSSPVHRLSSSWLGLFAPVTLNFAESPETELVDLVELQPAVLLAEARYLERHRAALERRMLDAPGYAKAAYGAAIGRGVAAEMLRTRSAPVSAWRSAFNATLGRLALRSVRRQLGGGEAVSWTVQGTVSPRLLAWYRAVGIPLREVAAPACGSEAEGQTDGRIPAQAEVDRARVEDELRMSLHIADARWEGDAIALSPDIESVLQFALGRKLPYTDNASLLAHPDIEALLRGVVQAVLSDHGSTARPRIQILVTR